MAAFKVDNVLLIENMRSEKRFEKVEGVSQRDVWQRS